MRFNSVLTKEVIAKLAYVPAHYNAANTPQKCMKGTRVDVIKDILVQLTSSPDSSRHLVMLSGVAGSGKSSIAKSVASILAEDKGLLAASFFFSRDYVGRKGIKHLATTLAFQLANYDTVFRAHLVKLLQDDTAGLLTADPEEQFKKMVVQILQKIPAHRKPWVICLDALDECGSDCGQIVLKWLSDSITQIPTHIRFFLTGRPNIPSYLKFHSLHSLVHGIILDQIDAKIVTKDIHLYIEHSLDGANWTTPQPWRIQSRDVDKITNQANGLFVFASTAVRYVLAGLPQTPPQESVDYLVGGEPLTDLHALYQRILDEAIPVPSQTDRRAQESHTRAIRILSTILQLFEPLDFPSLAALLRLDPEVLQGILLSLSAVIHVSDTPGVLVQIIHLSFREFMTSHIQLTRPEILCGTPTQQQALASDLMKVMQLELKFNICDLPTSYLQNVDMPDLQFRLDRCIPGHLRYACQFWVDHLVVSYDSHGAQMATHLLFEKFLFWLEVLSLLGMVKCASKALAKLILLEQKVYVIVT